MSGTEERANVRDLLRVRDFRRLYATRLTGQFADGLLQASLATFVLFSPERQPTALSVAIAFAVLYLPFSFVGPFAGVFLDRWRRRQVLVRANLLRALMCVGLIALVLARRDGVDLAVAVLLTLGVSRFVLAGLSASLPHVVDGPHLVTANALAPTSGTIAGAAGGLIGVALRSAAGGGDGGSALVLGLVIVGYLSSALIARLMAPDLLGPTGDRPGDRVIDVLRGLVDGARQLVRRPIAGRSILIVAVHRIALGALTAAALLLFRNLFNPGNPDAALRDFAFTTGLAAAGALLGAIITPRLTRRLGAVAWTVIAVGQAAIIVTAGMLTVSYPGLFVAAFSIGFAGQSAKVCADTLVQRSIPDDHLGRVFTLFDMAVNVGLVAGITAMALTSPADGVAPWSYLGAGLLLAVTVTWYGVTARRSVTAATP